MFTYGNHREDEAEEAKKADMGQNAQPNPLNTAVPPEGAEAPETTAGPEERAAGSGGENSAVGAETRAGAESSAEESGTEEAASAGEQPGTEELEEQLAALAAQLKDKEEQLTEAQNRLLRLQADFDNFRRRNTAERQELSTYVTIDVVNRFLKVLDNFERAGAAASSAVDVKSVADGMAGIHKQFIKTLEDLGVTEIPAQDGKFDPRLHEAVMRGQNPELAEDTIDMVFEKGYQYRDKVVRHSKVRVISNE